MKKMLGAFFACYGYLLFVLTAVGLIDNRVWCRCRQRVLGWGPFPNG